MDTSSRKPARRSERARGEERGEERGLARFEVRGRSADRPLIRAIARRLAEDGPQFVLLRERVTDAVSEEGPRKGGIYAALRASPLVGVDLDLERPRIAERDLDL